MRNQAALCRSVVLNGALSEIADAFQEKEKGKWEGERTSRRRGVIEMKQITGPRSTLRVDESIPLVRITYHACYDEQTG